VAVDNLGGGGQYLEACLLASEVHPECAHTCTCRDYALVYTRLYDTSNSISKHCLQAHEVLLEWRSDYSTTEGCDHERTSSLSYLSLVSKRYDGCVVV
jgi:hypothetical protein